MERRSYYEAYDERYKTAHTAGFRWFGDAPTEIVSEVLRRYEISPDAPILELGCGEGRDAVPLLEQGFNLLATDVSSEAVSYCKKRFSAFEARFRVLDCVRGELGGAYRFIFAVAVLHMLVPDADRNAFYHFIRRHLTADGIALICTMGDGIIERQSDISTAFDLQEREHNGSAVRVAATSCRMVRFDAFAAELASNGLYILETGLTSVPGEFSDLMYAVAKRA